MQCRIEKHQNHQIQGFCVNPNCEHWLYCVKCYREFHKEHLADCYPFDEGVEMLGSILSNQENLKAGLVGTLKIIQTKSGVLIQNLERNIRIIKDLNDMITNQRLEDIQKNIPLIKHFYSFQGQSDKGTKIENVIHDFQKIQEELEVQIQMLSNPIALYISKGTELLNNKQYEKAILEFDKALNLDPSSADAMILKAKALRFINEFSQAQIQIDQAAKINKRTFNLCLEQGNLLRNQNKYDEALLQYEESLQIDLNSSEALYGKGDCLLWLNKLEDARLCFEAVLKKEENNYSALVGYAQTLSKLKEFARARQLMKQVTQLEPNNQQIFYIQGMILKEEVIYRLQNPSFQDPQYTYLNCYEDALRSLYQAIQKTQDNMHIQLEYYDLQIKAQEKFPNKQVQQVLMSNLGYFINSFPNNLKGYFFIGKVLLMSERYQEAAERVEKGLQLEPNNSDLKNLKLQVEKHLKGKQIEQLIESKNFEQAYIQLKSNDLYGIPGFLALDKLILHLCQQEKVLEAFEIQKKQHKLQDELMKFEPSNTSVTYDDPKKRYTDYFCMKLFQMKQYAKVLECFDLIKSLPPSCYTNYHHYKGDCLIQMGKIDEGIKAFDEMLSGNQMTKFFYLQKKAQILVTCQRFQEALQCYDKYIVDAQEFIRKNNDKIKRGVKYNPTPDRMTGMLDVLTENDVKQFVGLHEIYYNRGIILGALERYSEAIEMMDLFISLQPTQNEKARIMKSTYLQLLGKKQSASKELEKMKKQSSTQHDDKKLKIVYLEAQVALLTQNNKLDDAIAIYEQLIEIEPSFVNFYLNLSNSFNHFRQTSILNIQIEEINQCVRLSYTNRPNQLKYFSIFMYHINQQETLVVLRLQQVIQEQKYGKALNILIKRMKIDKELNQQIKASNYFELIGIGLFNQSKYHKAKESFDLQLALFDTERDVEYNNAFYYKCFVSDLFQVYLYIDCENMIKQSRRFNIQLINLNVHLQYLFYQVQIIIFKGDTLFMKQQYDEAIIEYQKAANLNIRYCINIGDCLVRKHLYKEAIEQYDKLTESFIDQNQKKIVQIHKAQVLMIQGLNEEAVSLLQKELEKHVDFAQAHYYLSQGLQRIGKIEEAKQSLDSARQYGLEINDQTESLVDVIQDLTSDKAIRYHPYQQ